MKQITIHEYGPYRYVDCGYCENGCPDFRLLKKDEYTKRYHEIYLFDNQQQMLLAIEDYDYTLWLDNQPCYIKDTVKSPHR
jgi:Fe-S oxidoreductase